MNTSPLRLGLLLVAILWLAGCQPSGPPRVNLTGKVTYKGEHLTTGTVVFYPAETGAPVRAAINRDGTYRLTEALTGDYKIAINTPPKPKPGQKASPRPGGPIPVYVPNKYWKPETSGLQVTLKDTTGEFDIALTN